MKHNISKLLGRKQDNKLYAQSSKLIDNDTFIGVEVEVENVDYYSHRADMPDIFTLWKAVQDGSLREGTEFIFDGPLKGANITTALSLLQDFFNVYERKGEKAKITDRTSIHVHLDVTDINKEQLDNLISMYYIVERILFQYISPSRTKNNYCRPLTDSSFKFTLKSLITLSSDYDLIDAIRSDCDKYSALNILPVSSYGSVEFRHHHGTTNMEEVLNWINIIISLKMSAIKYPVQEMIDLYYEKGGKKVLKTIFAGTLLSEDSVLDNIEHIDEVMYHGVLDMREIINLEKLNEINDKKMKTVSSSSRTILNSYLESKGLVADFSLGA